MPGKGNANHLKPGNTLPRRIRPSRITKSDNKWITAGEEKSKIKKEIKRIPLAEYARKLNTLIANYENHCSGKFIKVSDMNASKIPLPDNIDVIYTKVDTLYRHYRTEFRHFKVGKPLQSKDFAEEFCQLLAPYIRGTDKGTKENRFAETIFRFIEMRHQFNRDSAESIMEFYGYKDVFKFHNSIEYIDNFLIAMRVVEKTADDQKLSQTPFISEGKGNYILHFSIDPSVLGRMRSSTYLHLFSDKLWISTDGDLLGADYKTAKVTKDNSISVPYDPATLSKGFRAMLREMNAPILNINTRVGKNHPGDVGKVHLIPFKESLRTIEFLSFSVETCIRYDPSKSYDRVVQYTMNDDKHNVEILMMCLHRTPKYNCRFNLWCNRQSIYNLSDCELSNTEDEYILLILSCFKLETFKGELQDLVRRAKTFIEEKRTLLKPFLMNKCCELSDKASLITKLLNSLCYNNSHEIISRYLISCESTVGKSYDIFVDRLNVLTGKKKNRNG